MNTNKNIKFQKTFGQNLANEQVIELLLTILISSKQIEKTLLIRTLKQMKLKKNIIGHPYIKKSNNYRFDSIINLINNLP